MSYSNFTSLPPEEEQQFVVFERRTKEASSKAMTMGLIAGGVVGFFLIVLYLTSDAPPQLHADALESDIPAETSKSDKPKAAPAATTDDESDEGESDEGESDEAEGETDEGAAEGDSAEGGAAEAPPPPKGATKAPPTDLVK